MTVPYCEGESEGMTISYEDCLVLRDKAQQAVITLVVDKPRKSYRSGRSDAVTEVTFECDVELFKAFEEVANAEVDKADLDTAKLMVRVAQVSERLSPTGITLIDAGEAYAIERISGAFISQADHQAACLALEGYQSFLDPIGFKNS